MQNKKKSISAITGYEIKNKISNKKWCYVKIVIQHSTKIHNFFHIFYSIQNFIHAQYDIDNNL